MSSEGTAIFGRSLHRGLRARRVTVDEGAAPRLLDRLCFIAVVLMACGLWLLNGRDATGAGPQADGGAPLATGSWAAAYLLGFAALARKRSVWLARVRSSRLLVVFLILTCVSCAWSDEPMLTARRSAELLGTSALSVYFVSRLGLLGFVETLNVAIWLLAATSAALIAFIPGVGYWVDAWSGLFSSKNFLGPAMVLGMLTTACVIARSTGFWRLLQIGFFGLFTVLLIGSRNVGGIGTAMFLAALIPSLMWFRARRSWKLALCAGTVLSALSGIALMWGSGADTLLGLSGRDATLSGRTDLWQLVLDAIGERPVLGYGYSVFWGLDGPAGRLVYPVIGWAPAAAHNGFLEVALNLGLVGEALLLLMLLIGISRAGIQFWQGRDLLSGWPLFAIVYVILSNVSNATFAMFGSLDWIILVAGLLFASEASVPTGDEPDSSPVSRRGRARVEKSSIYAEGI